LGSILSGTLLGYLADLWLDTRPWLVVVGIVAGSYAGFMAMWRQSKTIDSIERRRP
jgi:F0F1-type ATP synthase assembly protein I